MVSSMTQTNGESNLQKLLFLQLANYINSKDTLGESQTWSMVTDQDFI